MNHEHDFGGWLRRLRAAHDLTQEALAEAVGCAIQTIRSFESGRRRPSREMAARLASILEVPEAERERFTRLARTPVAAAEPAPGPTLAPAAGAGHAQPRPLPQVLDALIGRHADLQRLCDALRDERRRLVTLAGPGGIGKTRLALQAAAELAAENADGVAFAALAAASDAATAVTTIAEAAGSPPPGAQPPDAALLAFLRERRMLLVLDNLEHLLGGTQGEQITALLTGILREAPGVRLLITSRERLRLRSEWAIELGGLSVPGDEPGRAIERSDAVLLFLERARHVDSDFALTSKNREAVAQICRLLGGAPLAIELAAAWVRTLSCAEIAVEIGRNIDFLTLDDRDLPARHRSLRGVIDQSWQLLTAPEQELLAGLSVFQGGCQREAIEAICAGAAPEPISRATLLPLLMSLIDKSLVRRFTDRAGAVRYQLHELVRQYAAERLAEADPEAARRRHATHYAGWVALQEPALKSAGQKEAAAALSAEIDNIRSAWGWACEQRDAALLLEMASALQWFYEVRGWHNECTTALAQAEAALRPLAERADAPEATQAAYWIISGLEGWHARGRQPAFSMARLEAAIEQLRRFEGYYRQLHCINALAYMKIFAGDYGAARGLLDEAATIARETGNRWRLSMALTVRGVLEVLQSDAESARRQLHEALATARAVGDPRHIALTLNYIGLTALGLGQIEEAEQACRECLAIALEQQDRYQISLALQTLGRVALARGDQAEAAWLFSEGLALARAIGDRWLEAQALGGLGALASARGDQAEARRQHRAALSAAAAAPPALAIDTLAALADLELASSPQAALIALAYIRLHPRTRPPTRAAAQHRWDLAREATPADQLDAAEQRAQTFAAGPPAALLTLFG